MGDLAKHRSNTVDETIIEHLRDNFGRLMTDEQLTAIFQASIDKIVFTESKVCENPTAPSYQQRYKTIEPLAVRALASVIEKKVEAYFADWLSKDENQEKIMNLIRSEIPTPEKVLVSAVMGFLKEPLQELEFKIESRIQTMILENQ